MNWQLLWPYLVGYVYATAVGHILIYRLMKILWDTIGDGRQIMGHPHEPHKEHPMMLGILERALYVASIQFGKPEFVAIWLALKVAGQWKAWGEDRQLEDRTVAGRTVFNVFLIGNAFSIAYGAIGGLLSEWLGKNQLQTAIAASSALAAVNIGYWIWAARVRLSYRVSN